MVKESIEPSHPQERQATDGYLHNAKLILSLLGAALLGGETPRTNAEENIPVDRQLLSLTDQEIDGLRTYLQQAIAIERDNYTKSKTSPNYQKLIDKILSFLDSENVRTTKGGMEATYVEALSIAAGTLDLEKISKVTTDLTQKAPDKAGRVTSHTLNDLLSKHKVREALLLLQATKEHDTLPEAELQGMTRKAIEHTLAEIEREPSQRMTLLSQIGKLIELLAEDPASESIFGKLKDMPTKPLSVRTVETVRGAMETLKNNPGDVAANHAMAQYYMFTKQDFEKGLEHAKYSKDPVLLKLTTANEETLPIDRVRKIVAIYKENRDPTKTSPLRNFALQVASELADQHENAFIDKELNDIIMDLKTTPVAGGTTRVTSADPLVATPKLKNGNKYEFAFDGDDYVRTLVKNNGQPFTYEITFSANAVDTAHLIGTTNSSGAGIFLENGKITFSRHNGMQADRIQTNYQIKPGVEYEVAAQASATQMWLWAREAPNGEWKLEGTTLIGNGGNFRTSRHFDMIGARPENPPNGGNGFIPQAPFKGKISTARISGGTRYDDSKGPVKGAAVLADPQTAFLFSRETTNGSNVFLNNQPNGVVAGTGAKWEAKKNAE